MESEGKRGVVRDAAQELKQQQEQVLETATDQAADITTNTTWLGEDIRDPHDTSRGAGSDVY